VCLNETGDASRPLVYKVPPDSHFPSNYVWCFWGFFFGFFIFGFCFCFFVFCFFFPPKTNLKKKKKKQKKKKKRGKHDTSLSHAQHTTRAVNIP
jgi:hypothetical protein